MNAKGIHSCESSSREFDTVYSISSSRFAWGVVLPTYVQWISATPFSSKTSPTYMLLLVSEMPVVPLLVQLKLSPTSLLISILISRPFHTAAASS